MHAAGPLDEAADEARAIVQLLPRRRMAVSIQPAVHRAPHPVGRRRTDGGPVARLKGSSHIGFSSPSQLAALLRVRFKGVHVFRASMLDYLKERSDGTACS